MREAPQTFWILLRMKVQCEGCQATYTIDESKISAKGASAKCKKCGAKILIRRPVPVETKTAVCPKCGNPVGEEATACKVCGVVMAKYKTPAPLKDEPFEDEERFRMSELTETAADAAGVVDDEFPEQFSSGIGLRVKEARRTPKWLIGGILLLLVLLAFFQFGGERGWFGLLGGPVVSMSEYQKVANGMSYSQVAQIIGEPGEETGRSNIKSVPGVTANLETVSYQWINHDGSHMNAIFQNDRLISKTQFGLR
jgi:predicted Zn finger-like uncharacterized protein